MSATATPGDCQQQGRASRTSLPQLSLHEMLQSFPLHTFASHQRSQEFPKLPSSHRSCQNRANGVRFMPRLLLNDRTGPYDFPPSDTRILICGCGLSRNPPYCDGSHRIARKEPAGCVHIYEPETHNLLAVVPGNPSIEQVVTAIAAGSKKVSVSECAAGSCGKTGDKPCSSCGMPRCGDCCTDVACPNQAKKAI